MVMLVVGCVLYLHGLCGILNGSLVCVLYAYNGHLAMALIDLGGEKKNPDHDAHGNARIYHLPSTLHLSLFGIICICASYLRFALFDLYFLFAVAVCGLIVIVIV
jgi:hypothetical protein